MKETLGGGEVGAELTRDIAHKWKLLTAEERAGYEEMAAKDKKRYALELINWKQSQEPERDTASGGVPLPSTAEPAAWTGAVDEARQHPSNAARQFEEAKRGSGDFQYYAQSLRDTFDARQRPVNSNFMALPSLPNSMRQPTPHLQVGMSAGQSNQFIVHHQNQTLNIPEERQNTTVFGDDFHSPLQGLSSQRFDYHGEINRVARELGDDGVDLIIRLFRDAA